MKTRQTWLWIGAALAAVLLIVWGALGYRSPLLDAGGRNPPERIADFFAHSWFFSKALWLENTRRPDRAEAEKFRAAWFRPSLLATLFHLDPSDPLTLAGEYEKRGLLSLAGRLLARAASLTDDPDRLQRIVASVAGMNEWERLTAVLRGIPPRLFSEVNGDYWLGRALLETGRAAAALPYLERAGASDLADASFQLSRALQATGREKEALASLRRAVEISPAHREAILALGRSAAALTPALPIRAAFESDILILGFDPPSPRLTGEETVRCRMFYEVLRASPETLAARFSLKRENRPGAAKESAIALDRSDPGVVRTAVWEFALPGDVVPGDYRALIGFERGPGRPLRQLGSRSEEIGCGEVAVLPGVFAVPYVDRHLVELFGTDLVNLRRSTVLNGRDRVSLPLDPSRPFSGFGIVSYTQWSTGISQGTKIGEIEAVTDAGEVFRFPIEIGVHTADIWLANRGSGERAHGFAPLYRSREVERGGEKATANAYYFVFRFPRPSRLSKVTFTVSFGSLILSSIGVT